jgi:hypothetical protein
MLATMQVTPGIRAGRMVLLLAAAAALAGCASSGMDRGPGKLTDGGAATGVTPELPGCGQVPTSSGPAVATTTLVLTAPATAKAGEGVAVTVTIDAHANAGRIIATPATSRLLVARDGVIVGASPAAGDGSVPLPLRAGTSRPVRLFPAELRLVGCPTDGGAGRALPPGSYELIAVLGYRLDPLNATADATALTPSQGHGFALVSSPVPITIR